MNGFVAAMIADSMVRHEMEEIDHPHVMVCRDRASGFVSLAGPFPDGYSALLAAERDARTLEGPEGEHLEFSVLPLHPPLKAA